MIQLEHDRVGRDYSLNLKAYNPGVVDGTGVFMASYLQSLTKRFALGTEVIWQKPNADIEEANMSYMAKYVGGKDRDWIATATLQSAQGVINGTYWQRLSDKVEAGGAQGHSDIGCKVRLPLGKFESASRQPRKSISVLGTTVHACFRLPRYWRD